MMNIIVAHQYDTSPTHVRACVCQHQQQSAIIARIGLAERRTTHWRTLSCFFMHAAVANSCQQQQLRRTLSVGSTTSPVQICVNCEACKKVCRIQSSKGLTLLESQSRSGDKPVKFQVVCPPKRDCGSKWDKKGRIMMASASQFSKTHGCCCCAWRSCSTWANFVRTYVEHLKNESRA